MFGDTSQDVFIDVGILRIQITSSSGDIKTELAFILFFLGMARVEIMKVTTVPKLELPAALLAHK